MVDALPAAGLPADEIPEQLRSIAALDDQRWENGRCSGTMYCGDRDHHAVVNAAFGDFSHVNTLRRDICPSMTRLEREIIAMTLDLLNGGAVTDQAGSPRRAGPRCGASARTTTSSGRGRTSRPRSRSRTS